MLIATVDTDKDGGDVGEILKNGASNQANNLPGQSTLPLYILALGVDGCAWQRTNPDRCNL
jgi:hypothetical protein